MADVTVDAKPMEKLPYDSNDIPEAVRKRAAAVDALYTGSNGETPEPQSPPDGVPAPQASAQPVPPSPSPVSSAPADQAPENADSWKHRYLAMQGRYNATQKTIGEMQEQMMQLGNELMHAQQAPQARRQQQAPQQAYLTEQDVENYGPELISVTQRAALQAVEPKLREVEHSAINYEWIGPLTFSSAAANPVIPNATHDKEGIYKVKINKENGCWSLYGSTTVVVSFPDALSELSKYSELKVYPNPAKTGENLNIRIDINGMQKQAGTVRIYDYTGKLVVNKEIMVSSQFILPASQLPAGAYSLHLTFGDKEMVRKLMVD